MNETKYQEWLKDEILPSDEELAELEHHGIKGMKWGVRRTPAQLGHQPDKKKKKTSILSNLKKKRQQAKKLKAKKAEKKKKEKAEKEEESEEKTREKVLDSTDPKYIYKHRHLLTTKELQDRLNRIETESRVQKLTVDNKAKNAVRKGEDILKDIAAMADSINKVYSVYSSIEKDARTRQNYKDFLRDRESLTAQERARLVYQYGDAGKTGNSGGGGDKKKKKK